MPQEPDIKQLFLPTQEDLNELRAQWTAAYDSNPDDPRTSYLGQRVMAMESHIYEHELATRQNESSVTQTNSQNARLLQSQRIARSMLNFGR